MPEFAGKHILIIVENLAVPFDRRVWQEAKALHSEGAEVSVICPKMKGYRKGFEVIDGIRIYRHPLPLEARGAFGYLFEYLIALFFEFWLSWRIYLRKKFHVIHGCNPPDLIFLVAMPFKLLGVKFVFDQHDLNPELFIAKFNKQGWFYRLLVRFERWTFRTADYSIATNESYKEIAVSRGGMDAGRIAVVRSGPDTAFVRLQPSREELKKGKRFLIGYVGVIGEQEGLDLLIESAKIIREHRDDVHFAIVGGGTQLDYVRRYAQDRELDDMMDFYGRVDDQMLLDVLSTSDVCVNPDIPTAMNNLSTMNKIMEYMAMKKPIVQYDLKEGRFSAAEASLYARNIDVRDFAEKIMYLLDHPEKRKAMGEAGYERLVHTLSWEHQKLILFDFYKRVLA
jgi:glycosyltransferase involved in cell wall biosynthesis